MKFISANKLYIRSYDHNSQVDEGLKKHDAYSALPFVFTNARAVGEEGSILRLALWGNRSRK